MEEQTKSEGAVQPTKRQKKTSRAKKIIKIVCIIGLAAAVLLIVKCSVNQNGELQAPWTDIMNRSNGRDSNGILLDTLTTSGGTGTIDPDAYTELDSNSDAFLSGHEVGKFPEIQLKTPEELDKQGLTAEEVLEAYDLLAIRSLQEWFGTEKTQEKYGDLWFDISAQFDSISVHSVTSSYHYTAWPGYYIPEEFEYGVKWFFHNLRTPVESGPLSHIYPTTLHINYKNTADRILPMGGFGVDKDQFEAIMKAFDVSSFVWNETLATEYVDSLGQLPTPFLVANYYGDTMYDPNFTITRDLIRNADQEQLRALYEALDSMITINFVGKAYKEYDR